ncbi:TonB-dependent receptor [Novosphingobium sp. JCM 18896]|uniref:TonB-dependent receptor n=1 Tax=Novosphingobium sp. JCM 18896 TaxID=2989731 RepID=UPI002223A12E|nr:TonB-dependent receptor [Novosphingobium sp. JCM 18896]MCW1429015.1 TonB-dependent receptor [Novosphingobium sp. JCM 18896]
MAALLTTFRARALTSAALAGLAAMSAVPAFAQDAAADTGGLEEIVVTAQHRQERLQDVPIAVSAVTASALRESGVDTTRDLPQIIPSVQFTRSGPSGLFFVRGVGTTNAAAGEEGANAVYVDGVYMADLGQTINYFNNIERVEVLKGPQGTLFGRNATGGLVHVITREPGDEWVLDGDFGYANYETVSARAYVAAPITEGLSADIAVTRYHQNEGWGRNLTRGDKNFIQDYSGIRSKIVARPTDRIKLILSGDYLENRDNPVGWRIADGTIGTGLSRGPDVPGTPAGAVVADDHDTTANDLALTKQRIYGGSFTGEFDLGFATLTSVSAYRNTRTNSDFDVDGGPISLIRIQFLSGMKSFQQEVRLASTGSGPLQWQFGGFYLNTKANNTSFFSGGAFGTARGQDVRAKLDSNSYAAFGEATYAITPTTKLTGGIRYTEDRRSFDASQFTILANGTALPGGTVTNPSGQPLTAPGIQRTKLKYNQVTWRAALRQELTPDISVYASANRGFKSGSYSLQNPLNDPYLPQTIMAYEIGFKSELFDRRLRLNLAAFHYDIDDYQVRSAAAANPGSSLVLNAATVKVDGVEFEFEAKPTDNLRLFGGATWLNSRYGTFGGAGQNFQAPIVYPVIAGQTAAATCPAALRGTRNPGVVPAGGVWTGGYVTCFGDASGNKVSNAPDFAASFGATYTVPLGDERELRLTGLYAFNSGYYFEPDNIAKQDEYHLLNASIEYRSSEHLGVEIWGRNLTNTDYAVQKITTGTGTTQSNGAPRTYGATVKFNF